MRFHLLLFIALLCLIGPLGPCAQPSGDAPEAAFRPLPNAARLEVGGLRLKPVRVTVPWVPSCFVRPMRLILDGPRVASVRRDTGARVWSATAPDGQRLGFLDADPGLACFSSAPTRSELAAAGEAPVMVRLLNLTSGRWLPPLDFGRASSDAVVAALIGVDRLVILSVHRRGVASGRASAERSVRITCFPRTGGKPLWIRTFPSGGSLPSPTAFLLAANGPEAASPELRHLSWLGLDRDVVVCAGPLDDVACLDGATGKDLWRIPRIWEFQRTFIGPSVWQHFIARYGADGPEAFIDQSPSHPPGEAALTEAFNRQYQCAIVAGPLVLPHDRSYGGFDSPRTGRSVFVAVARGPARPWAEELSECVVYEISEGGSVTSITVAPRMIRGDLFRIRRNGIVWACQNQAMLEVGPSDRGDLFMGPGGPDRTGRILWYREAAAPEPRAWLGADAAADVVAFTHDHAYRPAAGGYVRSRAEHVYRFPISEIALATGGDRTLTLSVPFTAALPPPAHNYRAEGVEGAMTYHTVGPYRLGVTALAADDSGQLWIGLGMNDWSAALEFDLRQKPGVLRTVRPNRRTAPRTPDVRPRVTSGRPG